MLLSELQFKDSIKLNSSEAGRIKYAKGNREHFDKKIYFEIFNIEQTICQQEVKLFDWFTSCSDLKN